MENCIFMGQFYLENPTIDAHFWVERDGEIIDPHFERQFKRIQKVWRLTEDKGYLEASDEIQEAVINHFKKCVMKQLKVRNWEKALEIVKQAMEYTGYTPQFGDCWKNVLYEIIHRGGTIKFGSFGFFKTIVETQVHWEFGGENWTIKQFGKGREFCKVAKK